MMVATNFFRRFRLPGRKPSPSRQRLALAVMETLEVRQLLADLSSTYTWAPVAIGGGGWMDGVIASATNPNVRFVRDDTGQAYRWNAAVAQWIPMVVQNVNGGNVSGFGTSIIHDPSQEAPATISSFALDPNNNSTLYMYVQFGTTGGEGLIYSSLPFNVYKSTDGGQNFTATNFAADAGFTYTGGNTSTWVSDTFSSDFRYDGDRLAVDPNNSNVVYIGTGTKGLWKSTDGGTDWTAMTGTGLPTGVDDMNIIPYAGGGTTVVNGVSVSKTLYLVTAQGDVYLSTNGGQTWADTTTGVGPTGQCYGATLDPNTGVLYVPTTGGILWKYSSGTWTNLKSNNATTVTVDPANSYILIVEGNDQVADTTNGGSTWTNLSFAYSGAEGFAGNPADPTPLSISKLLMDMSGTVWMVEGNDALLKWQYAAGNSASWTPAVTGIENFCGQDINFPANDGGKAIVSVEDDNGMVLNTLDTYNVTLIEPQTVLAEGTTVSVCPNDPNTFALETLDWKGTSLAGITTNGGATYTTFVSMNALPTDLSATQGGSIEISARGNWSAGADHLVWLGADGIPWYSTNGGQTWAESASFAGLTLSVTNNTPWLTDREMVADPFVPNKFYLYYDYCKHGNTTVSGFWTSIDGGATWTQGNSPAGNPGGHEIMADNVPGDLWLSTLGKGLWHSTNSGSTWTQVMGNQGVPLNGVSIAIGKGDGVAGDAPYTLYYLFGNLAAGRYIPATDYGIYRSTKYGMSWNKIADWPAGYLVDSDDGDAYSMMSASWDTFGLVGLNTAGQGFVFGMPNAAWTGLAPTDGNFGDAANWAGLTVPGDSTDTTSAKAVTFNAGNNTWGNSAANPIAIDSTTQNIDGIIFDDYAGNYYLGSMGGNALLLTNGGNISMLSTLTAASAVDTVNAPLVIEGSNGNYTFTNNSVNGNGDQAGTLNFGGNIAGGTAGTTVLTLNGTNANSNTLSGIISNGAANSLAIAASGTGNWTLSANNTYTGGTTVSAGTLELNTGSASGSAASPLTPAGTGNLTLSGGTLDLYTTAATANDAIYIGGNITVTGNSIIDITGANGNYQTFHFVGNLTLGAGDTLTVQTAANMNAAFDGATTLLGNATITRSGGAAKVCLNGAIGDGSHGYGLTANGAGSGQLLILTGTNTYTGATTVTGGILQIGNGIAGSISAASAVAVNSAGILAFAAANGAVIANTIANAGSVTGVESTGITNTISGNISGNGSFSQTGAGTTLLSGSNVYTGNTTVSAGTLAVASTTGTGATTVTGGTLTVVNATGSATGTNNVAINNGGNLGGSGTMAPTGTFGKLIAMASGAQLSPSLGAATTTALKAKVNSSSSAAALDVAGGTIFNYNFAGPGTSDTLTVTGNITLESGTDTLNINQLGGFGVGNYTLLTASNLTDTVTSWALPSSPYYLYSISNTSTTLKLVVVSAGPAVTWNGNISGSWDTVTHNWQASALYQNQASVILDDTAAGPNFTVDLGGATLSPDGVFVNNTAHAYIIGNGTIADSVLGPALLVKNGTSILTLAGSNTYTGATTVTAGTLQIGNGSAGSIAAASGIAVDSAGILSFDEVNGSTIVNTIVNAGSVTGADTTGITNILSGNISGAGSFGQIGAGTTVFTGSNTYTGGTTVSAGTLELNTGSATGSSASPLTPAGIGNITLSGGMLELYTMDIAANAAIYIGDNLAVTGNTTLSITGAYGNNQTIHFVGNLSLGAGATLTVAAAPNINAAFDGAITLNGSGVTITPAGTAGAANVYLNGAIGDGGHGYGLITSGAGSGQMLILTGNNTYTGGTTVAGGTLLLAGSGTLGATTAPLIMNGGTLDLGNSSQTVAAVTIAAAAASGNTIQNGSLTSPTYTASNPSGRATVAAILPGSGSLTENGAGGTLILSGNNSYTGATTVTAGTLQIGNGAAGAIAVASAISVLGGTLAFDEANGATITANIANAGSLTGGESTGSTNTLSGNISGNGSFSQTGTGATVLGGDNVYTGNTTVTAGTLDLANVLALYGNNSAQWTAANLTVATGATLALAVGGAGQFTSANIAALIALGNATNGFQSGSAIALDTTGGNLTCASVIANPNSGANALSLIKLGNNTLTLLGNCTYTGATTLTAGTLQIGNGTSGAITGSNAIAVSSAAILSFDVVNGAIMAGNISLAGNATLIDTVSNGSTNTFSGVISGGGSVSLIGPGVTVLSGGNTFAGGVILSNKGQLKLAGPSLGVVGSIISSPLGIGTLTLNSTAGAAVWIDADTATSGQVRTILNPVIIVSDIQFGTYQDGAKINIAGPVTLGATSNIEVRGGALGTTIPQGFLQISGNISDGGHGYGLTTTGTFEADLILAGNNTYSGNTTITANGYGTGIIVNSAHALGTGNVSVGAGAALMYTAYTNAPLAIGGNLSLTGGSNAAIIGAAIGATATSAAINVAGVASATGNVKVDVYGISGVAPLSGTNTYTLVQGAAGSSLNSAGNYTLQDVFNNSNFTIGAIGNTSTTLTIAVTSQTPLTSAYWKGGYNGSYNGETNTWAASNGSSQSNWVATPGGANQALVPGPGTNVFISNSSIANPPTATVLGDNLTINSLTVQDTTNGLRLNADGNTLTIAPASSSAGITVNAAVPASIIAASVNLGAAQTWTNNSANVLTVSGAISGANALTTAGTGTVIFTGSNSYTGATTVTGGTLQIGNGTAGSIAAASTVSVSASASLILDEANGSTMANTIANAGSVTGIEAVGITNTFSGNISGTGSFSQTGTGTTVFSGAISLAAMVNNGAVDINGAGAIGQLTGNGSLTIGTGIANNSVQITAAATPDSFNNIQQSVTIGVGSTLDITNNKLLLNYGSGSSPLAAVQAAVANGVILSSTANAGQPGQFTVGYADATELGAIASGNVEMMFTLAGDALLAGTVNFNDFSTLQNNYNQSGRDWSQGDFNHDGLVNFNDYSLLQNNYNQRLADVLSGAAIINQAAATAKSPAKTRNSGVIRGAALTKLTGHGANAPVIMPTLNTVEDAAYRLYAPATEILFAAQAIL